MHNYYTSLHKHSHWTGHESRLNRKFGQRFGDSAYAFEELFAKLASAFVAARLGIKADMQHADYIGHWLEIMRADKGRYFQPREWRKRPRSTFLPSRESKRTRPRKIGAFSFDTLLGLLE